MSDAPFVPFYTSDFLAGTSGMTSASKGVYITLLCLMYESEAPLAQSWETLARRCGCTLPAFRRAIESLQDDGKITLSDAGIWSTKCDRHITQRRERQSSATAAAKARWEKEKEKQRVADATAMRWQCQPEPEPEPERKEPPYPPRGDRPAVERGPGFEEFWSSWPLAKVGKQKAQAAFKRLSAEGRTMATERAASWAKRWREKHPTAADIHPTTYLNGKRWEDEATATRSQPPPGPDTWKPEAVIPSQMFAHLMPPPKRRTA